MRRFKSILVYVNVDSEPQQALGRAVELAERNDAALSVVADVETTAWTKRLLTDVSDRDAARVRETSEKLEVLTAPYADRGISLNAKTLVGRPWLELVREVLKNDHDLVIKDIEPKNEAEGIFSPHMDMRLLRKCPCPVWLVRPQAHSFRRIAAAVDVFPEDSTTRALSKKIVQLAKSMADDEGSELHVVCVWSVYAHSVLKYKMAPEELENVRNRTREAVGDAVHDLLQASEGKAEPRVRLLEGEPEMAISQLVEREHEDLVVMGTVARTGLAGALIGNTAEKILRQITCSLLAVKPDGFISPVRLEH